MRLFIAVELPAEVREVLAAGLGRLKRDQPPARWVRIEGMHLTLKFLGEQPDELVERLDGAVRPALAPLPHVHVRLGQGGFFPHERRPRVAWIGGEAAGLERWAAAVDDATSSLGVEKEARPFSLHLTLARLERPWGVQAVEHYLVQVGKWRFSEFTAREAVLFRSELGPAGATYTALRRWPAGATAEGGDVS
ncbi:MAG TPA: RNA 2',3'-cyclic phosphodiesterase [Thermoanaerobaculaceae bacterium]|nr:RNA 2',3'-cyclic phosphodiesterase [Thermoanaerobaculaceae bacterium]